MAANSSIMVVCPHSVNRGAACAQTGSNLWLVFRDEGLSLHSLMYAPVAAGDPASRGDNPGGRRAKSSTLGAPAFLQPSEWWWQLRQGPRVRWPPRLRFKAGAPACVAVNDYGCACCYLRNRTWR